MRSRLGSESNATSIGCVVYNYYGNEANSTSCAIPSQGTGDDGNVLGKYYQDNVNSTLSHTTSMSYDPTHRLTGAVASGSSTYNLAFAYDQYGNMTCQQNQQTQGLCPQYSFSSSTNQITNSGYTYDASGDLTNDGTHTYQYDAEGRLVSVNNGSTASYVYNALGERVEKDVSGTYTEYAFDRDGEPEAENNRGSSNGGWVDSWVNFEGQHIAHYENGGVYYIYSNQVGTAGFVTDWTGAVLQDELHYPWGKVWTTMGTQTEERFASLHHRDAATNLDPTHFRMYSSDEGRWLTPDPAQADIYNPQSMSRYAYAGENPFAFVDPSGALLSLEQVWSGWDLAGVSGYGYSLGYQAVPSFSSIPMNGAAGCPNNACSIIGPDPYTGRQTFLQFTPSPGASGYLSAYDWSQGVNAINGAYMSNAAYNAYIQANCSGDIGEQGAALAAKIAANCSGAAAAQRACNETEQAILAGGGVGGFLNGGNYNFYNSAGLSASDLSCGANRCNGIHIDNGYIHLDTANPWSRPLGFFEHGFVDVFLGNTLYSGTGFIPRPFP